MAEDRTTDDLLDAGTTVLLVGADLRGRPMTVQTVEGSSVWFLTSRSSDWVEALDADDRMGLLLQDDDEGVWASMHGSAVLVDDRERMHELWSGPEKAWFEGPDDPDLVALRLDMADGEWWDAPGSTVARSVKMLAAMVSDDAEVGGQGDLATS